MSTPSRFIPFEGEPWEQVMPLGPDGRPRDIVEFVLHEGTEALAGAAIHLTMSKITFRLKNTVVEMEPFRSGMRVVRVARFEYEEVAPNGQAPSP